MELIIGIIIFYIIFKLPEWKFNNRMPPNGHETDWGAMSSDLASGKSKTEVMNKANRGGYDVPKSK